jgi:hypothetical protein
MTTPSDICQSLLAWIRTANPEVTELDPATPLLSSGILTSLELTDLLFEIERLRGEPIEAEELVPHVFRDVNSILAGFFQDRIHFVEEAVP